MQDRSRLSRGEAFSFRPPLRVGIIGAGRVSRAVAAALVKKGHVIARVASASHESARTMAAALGVEAGSIADTTGGVDLVVIAVPDDSLADVIFEVSEHVGKHTWVVHTSGRSGAEILSSCGSRVAAVHPARPIPDGDASLDGIAFGVTCSSEVWPFAEWFVKQLGGTPIEIAEEDRVLYHAGLVIASNFATALVADAISLSGRDAVLPLLRATLENLERLDADDALTGPVVRGDVDTIRLHLKEIETRAPHLRDVYMANSRRILDRARAAGKITAERAASVEGVLA